MSIILDKNPEDYGINVNIAGEESVEAFKTLVSRALNVWPEAHPEMKELGDLLEHGRILQDYWSSRTDIKSKKPNPDLPSPGQCSGEELKLRMTPGNVK